MEREKNLLGEVHNVGGAAEGILVIDVARVLGRRALEVGDGQDGHDGGGGRGGREGEEGGEGELHFDRVGFEGLERFCWNVRECVASVRRNDDRY